ncbi:TonB-dependent receptor [Novosphingobium sp. ERN07]|uniref:TonB-dependent receptor n=1 Tax=Novosphingobium sp. ERN07 TaxID=2726187 RepID=UPI00182B0472|nr:TonB-dependent receptor [Novosphingobium sp. ERN07]NLR73438.1 TonB-dependent receptor [Novosphingobium sp. ERN07]
MRKLALASVVSGIAFAVALSASSSAQAAEEAPDDETIIVTARFKAERLQDTPLAITAVTGEALSARGALDVTDVSGLAPNLYLAAGGTALGKSAGVSIRGIGEGDYNFSVEPAVGMYIDDVYHATVFGSIFDLLDVNRVEVLRGPQGTLFGKNSVGGAIRVISNQPRGDNSGSLSMTVGSFGRYEGRGMLDIGLVPDRMMLRIAAGVRHRDGFMKVLDFACANPTLVGPMTGNLSYVLRARTTDSSCQVGTMGATTVVSGRATLKAVLSDRLTATITADMSSDKGEQAPAKLLSINTALAAFNTNIAIPRYGIPFDGRFLTNSLYTSYAGFSAAAFGLDQPNQSDVVGWGVSGVLDFAVNDAMSLKSITAYRKYHGIFGRDGDSSPLDVGGSRNWLYHNQFSQELRLSGDSLDKLLEWTLGGYYFRNSGRTISETDTPTIPQLALGDDRASSRSWAGFLNVTANVTSQLSLTGGLRYSDESKTYSFYRATYPNRVAFINNAPGAVSYNRWDWKLGADYKITDNIMAYVSASTGFRAGGFNPRPSTAAQITPVYPETLVEYEAGFKSELFDRLLRLNVAAFTGNYKGLQMNASSFDLNGVIAIVRTNVGRSRIRGFEVEATLRPARGLEFSGSLGLTDYKYLALGGAEIVRGGPCLSCVPALVPRWTSTLSGEYSTYIGQLGKASLRLDYRHRSKVFTDLPNTPEAALAPLDLLNARVGWTSPDGDWTASVGVTNLADKEYYSAISPLASAGRLGTPGAPREWSFTLSRQF